MSIPDNRMKEQCAHCLEVIWVDADTWQANTQYYCVAHALLKGRDPQFIVPQAVADARNDLSAHSSTFMKFSLPSLHRLLGFLMRGTVTYGCALPGNGKTAFVSQQIAHWAQEGKRVWVMPTESRPKGLMTRLVCRRLGISADEALSGRLREAMDNGDLQAREDHRALERAYRQLEDTLQERDGNIAIEPAPSLTRRIFRESCEAAAQWGADILITDHIDHVKGDETTGTGYQASEAVQNDALEFGELFNLPLLLMSQLNRSKTMGDPLALYRQPQLSHLWMPGAKEQNATGIFGLFRPMKIDLDDALAKSIKDGRAPSWKVAVEQCMGVLDMKKRFGGEHRDGIAYLEYRHGTLAEPSDILRRELEADAAGIRTLPYYRDNVA